MQGLKAEDFLLDYGELGNFSVAGFEMVLHRHVSHYLITYYLPSGTSSPATCPQVPHHLLPALRYFIIYYLF
jgi:hypothetical protein